MTKQKTYLLIAIIAVVIFSSIININLSTHKLSSTSYWLNQSDVKTEFVTENFIDDNTAKTITFDVSLNKGSFQTPINIKGVKNIDLDIDSDIYIGLGRFLPLFKITKFKSRFNVSWTGIVMQNGRAVKVAKSGLLNVEGSSKMTGLISAKMAKKQIQNMLINQVKDNITKDIKDETQKIESITAKL